MHHANCAGPWRSQLLTPRDQMSPPLATTPWRGDPAKGNKVAGLWVLFGTGLHELRPGCCCFHDSVQSMECSIVLRQLSKCRTQYGSRAAYTCMLSIAWPRSSMTEAALRLLFGPVWPLEREKIPCSAGLSTGEGGRSWLGQGAAEESTARLSCQQAGGATAWGGETMFLVSKSSKQVCFLPQAPKGSNS